MIKLKSLIKEALGADDVEYQNWRQKMSNADIEHGKALATTGFWGKQGAGAIILAKATGRILLPYRSARVEQPNTWGVWGGAIDEGDDPKATVKKEMKEEVGYTGTILNILPLYVFKDQRTGFQYHNFITIVPEEFQPTLNWETEDYDWVNFGDWPQPLHFGLKTLIQNSGGDIQKIVEKNKAGEGLTESDGNPFIVSRGFWSSK
jgi:8-oxo-dGTP pyrophosphatase MutT (NUDIX family)